MTPFSRLASAVLVATAVSACTTKKVEPPAPSGPSELATSLTLSASPDVLTQDGQSTSQIVIFARDANAQPIRGLPVRADIMVGGVVTDFGLLSAKSLSTGNDGRAVTVYTAPRNVDSVDRQTHVTISVTPLTGDARSDFARQVDIRLVPPGVVGGGPTTVPDFSISPANPKQLETVLFNAADPLLDGKLIAYVWDFGDGDSGSGRTASHAYREAGTYSVTLTVTDATNASGSRSKSVQVGAGDLPVANFVFSPTEPGIGQEVVFNGSGSTATAPRSIVSYKWQFGTTSTKTGMIVTKKYDTAGTYNVTLTVTDDAGNKGTASQEVEVGKDSEGGLTARFTFSPVSPTPGSSVSFNATTSSSADPIVSYKWNFGDGAAPVTTASPTTSHTYANPGEYVVTLTITDSKGRTSTTTQNVTVATP
jgi:PKD repeat protein